MRVTKFVHSCLLVETDSARILIDPGSFSWQSGIIELHKWPKIDYVLVTHLHPDHCWPDFLRALKDHSDPRILTNPEVQDALAKNSIDLKPVDKVPGIEAKNGKHAQLWGNLEAPTNTIFAIGDILTVTGDTHAAKNTTDVLAMPIYAPWGSFKEALQAVMRLKPKRYLPVHDWFFSEEARAWHYDRAEETLSPMGIELIRPESKVAFEI